MKPLHSSWCLILCRSQKGFSQSSDVWRKCLNTSRDTLFHLLQQFLCINTDLLAARDLLFSLWTPSSLLKRSHMRHTTMFKPLQTAVLLSTRIICFTVERGNRKIYSFGRSTITKHLTNSSPAACIIYWFLFQLITKEFRGSRKTDKFSFFSNWPCTTSLKVSVINPLLKKWHLIQEF